MIAEHNIALLYIIYGKTMWYHTAIRLQLQNHDRERVRSGADEDVSEVDGEIITLVNHNRRIENEQYKPI